MNVLADDCAKAAKRTRIIPRRKRKRAPSTSAQLFNHFNLFNRTKESIPVWQATNGQNFVPHSVSSNGNRENRLHLPSTQSWRNLCLFNNGAQQWNTTMEPQVEELNDVRSRFGESGQLVLAESSLATELKTTKDELIEARKQANEYREELRKMQDSLKEANLKINNFMYTNNPPTQVDQQVMFHKCLQDKEKELDELKKQLDLAAQKQIQTEKEQIETREQFKSFVVKSMEMTRTKQQEVKQMLHDIQISLWKKTPEYRPSCPTENESINEEKIFNDIKALIEYDLQSAKSENNSKKNTAEIALETDSGSGSLRVSEYEMHLVTLISSFLKVTPFPVNSSFIFSYVANIDNIVDLKFVENLLRKFPSFFKEVAAAPGSMDKNWTYLDLKPVITI